MEILMLVLLYYLSQNPDFAESVKPIMNKLKNSEQMLSFLNDLSKFSQTFSSVQNTPCGHNPPPKPPKDSSQNSSYDKSKEKENKNPQSPTKGIADEFIQNILDSYLQNTVK